MEALEAHDLLGHREWKASVEHQLHVVRVILHDMRDAVGLATSEQGSASRRLQELLEGLGTAMLNIEGIIQPEEANSATGWTNQQILRRILGQRSDEDQYGDDVETDDFTDPLEDMDI